VAPLPGSPLVLDLHNILITLGIPEVAIRYAGGSLLSVINYLTATDALALMPFSVAFSFRRENKITVIPLDIPQPERALGVMTKRKPYANPASRKFIGHLRREFSELRRMIEKHDSSIPWAHGPFMTERDRRPMA
jgi:DNA-binding transcriptional LysR family regulator